MKSWRSSGMAGKGTLTQFQSVKTLAEGFKDPSTAAEIAVHARRQIPLRDESRGGQHRGVLPSMRRAASSRFKQRVSSGGKVPRYFTFDPTNKWFIVSNQDGANVNVFSVDAKTGELAQKGTPVALVKPMALAFIK